MSTTVPGCYAGKILRVDLTNNHIWTQPWTPEMCRTALGGVGPTGREIYRTQGGGRHLAVQDTNQVVYFFQPTIYRKQ